MRDDYVPDEDRVEPVYLMALYLLVAQHLKAIEEEWAARKSFPERFLEGQYGNGLYVSRIEIEYEGEPVAYVAYVDDVLQVVPYKFAPRSTASWDSE